MLLIGLACALLVALGVPYRHVALVGLSLAHPGLGLAAGGVGLARHLHRHRTRTSGPAVEARYLRAVADELRGGAALRWAFVDAAARVPELDLRPVLRAAAAGLPMEEVAARLRERLPRLGPLAASAVAVAGLTGAPAAAVFDALGAHADDLVSLEREIRTQTGQARLSAAVVALAPAPLALWSLLRVGAVVGDPLVAGIVGVGVLLELAGVAVIALMVRRFR